MAIPYGGKEVFEGRKCWEVLFPGQIGPCDFCPQKHIIDGNEKPSSVYTWDYQRAFDGSWFRVFSSAFYWTDGLNLVNSLKEYQCLRIVYIVKVEMNL